MQCKKDSFHGRAALGIEKIPVKKEHAFTLIELLAVIAIIVLLLSIFVPSLEKVKDIAAMKLCGSNARQIMPASAIYSNDNKEQAPRSTTRYIPEGDELGNKSSWVCLSVINPNVSPTTTGDFVPAVATIKATHDQRLAGIRHGTLYPYLGDTEVHNIYSDIFVNKPSVNVCYYNHQSLSAYPSSRNTDFYEITRLLDNYGYTTKVLRFAWNTN